MISPELAEVWVRSRPLLEARLKAVESALAGTESRERALLEAHRLAGSLGTFGLERGSELARRLEAGLEGGAATAALLPLAAELRRLLASAT